MAKSFKITGLNKLSSKLKKNVTMNDVKQVVKNNTAELTNAARRNAPVDTGFLKRSIVMELANGGYVGRSIAGAEYAPYIEYGTRFMASQPFMAPAYRLQKKKFKSDLERLMK